MKPVPFLALASTIDLSYQIHRKNTNLYWREYDLLPALYAGSISVSCAKHVRHAGIIVSNNRHGDAQMGICDPSLSLGGNHPKKGGCYVADRGDGDALLQTLCAHRMPARSMRGAGNVAEYVDKDTYFVLRKASY